MPRNIKDLCELANATPSGHDILNECLAIAELLLEKNKKYGDSALRPRRIFSRASAAAQIETRLDDKLSRIENAVEGKEDEDVVLDLMGYCVLLRIARKRAAAADAAERAP